MSAPAVEGRIARSLGLFLLLGGLGIQGAVFAFGGWPTLGPLLLAACGVPPLVLGMMAIRAQAAGRPRPFLLRHADGTALLGFLAMLLSLAFLVGVEREETYPMYWSFDRSEDGPPDRNRILLEFADHPGWVSRINSRDLGEYLEGLGTDRVPVVFKVTRDFGSARGFIEVKVGERNSWKDLGGGGFSRRRTARVVGEIGPSPFR